MKATEMKFTLREWLWGICAYLRFWNKKFHSPYQGLTCRKALVLMRIRGEQPMTVDECLRALTDQDAREQATVFVSPEGQRYRLFLNWNSEKLAWDWNTEPVHDCVGIAAVRCK